ncbi:DNA polymerase epsilon subunit b [Striga asiatica]|uniref:DNA polymerase epsilon subunit b n=1 Tax=Striga asiatica TaxID=4170 RepID=A0A5A7QNS1_STRAF|nr:DNA polymerase epsilon subunit b [Striga asiatica]
MYGYPMPMGNMVFRPPLVGAVPGPYNLNIASEVVAAAMGKVFSFMNPCRNRILTDSRREKRTQGRHTMLGPSLLGAVETPDKTKTSEETLIPWKICYTASGGGDGI